MKRRNAEKQEHPLEKQLFQEENIYELQGLLLDKSDTFTAAVEAVEFDIDEKGEKARTVFKPDEWAAKLALADAINVPLYLFLHIVGEKHIHSYEISSDIEKVKDHIMTEKEFLTWWREHKQTEQTKEYRDDFKDYVKGSYFDNLLEMNGLKWGGNIDGFIIQDAKKKNVLAIIENRFTNNYSITKYDPSAFYKSDVMTWKPLIILKDILDVPLILCTFSKRVGEDNIIGISEIISCDGQMNYRDGIKPYENLFTSIDAAKDYINQIIQSYGGDKI